MIQTKRLLLRLWREEDIEPYAKLNADPRVMEFFPSVKTREESMAEVRRFQDHFAKWGYGFWAVEVPSVAPLIGFIGLRFDDFPAPFTPAVEVGWRLAFDYWGQGYATEGALASLQYGFEKLQLPEIISFTSTLNTRSMAVMKRIGMHRDPKDDFNHPYLPEGHRLRKHVLYRIGKEEWKSLSNL